MVNITLLHSFLVAIILAVVAWASDGPPKTFCNPLNLDYGISVKKAIAYRHGADPVIVLFNDRYCLFSTWDKPGYRVSDDLLTWKFVPFARGTELDGHIYTAAATMVLDGWLYFTELGRPNKPAALWRTREPDSGKWEKVRTFANVYRDPCLFVDPQSGRVFMYHGLEDPIRGVELDRKTFEEVEGTDTQLLAPVDIKHIENGWDVCTWDNSESSKGMRSDGTFRTCREGSWMTFVGGKYYLQFATPGTTVPGYCDAYAIGDSPLGPFKISPASPMSRKDSGFITSAGHSCLFEDRYGNSWRVVTMLIGVHDRFERRIGLFPAGFDRDGIGYTRTELGDTPIVMAQGKRDHLSDEVYAGWFVLSRGAKVTTSSALPDHPVEAAADEDIRTWWSAARGDANQWMQIDLGSVKETRAVQINLTEQDYHLIEGAPDAHRFILSASDDGDTWTKLLDRSDSDQTSPYTYVQFEQPLNARFFKLENAVTPGTGKFAVSDLRVFGVGHGAKPQAVGGVAAKRDADRRNATVSWKPADGATSYLIRYGIAKDKLYQHRLVNDGRRTEETLHCLSGQPAYFFRVDALNESGMTSGTETVECP